MSYTQMQFVSGQSWCSLCIIKKTPLRSVQRTANANGYVPAYGSKTPIQWREEVIDTSHYSKAFSVSPDWLSTLTTVQLVLWPVDFAFSGAVPVGTTFNASILPTGLKSISRGICFLILWQPGCIFSYINGIMSHKSKRIGHHNKAIFANGNIHSEIIKYIAKITAYPPSVRTILENSANHPTSSFSLSNPSRRRLNRLDTQFS